MFGTSKILKLVVQVFTICFSQTYNINKESNKLLTKKNHVMSCLPSIYFYILFQR